MISINVPFRQITLEIQTALERAALRDIAVIYNASASQDQQGTTRIPHIPVRYDPGSYACPEVYYLQGDKSVQDILLYMGYSAQTFAKIVGSGLVAGIASLILSYEVDGKYPSKNRRQIVKERFDELARRSFTPADRIDKSGTGQQGKMPWLPVKPIVVGNFPEGPYLGAMLF